MYRGIVILQNKDGRWSVSWNINDQPHALTFFDFEQASRHVENLLAGAQTTVAIK